MPDRTGFPTPEEMLQSRIVDWLRQADSLIRSGKFTAAAEVLQKIFDVKPGHDVATAYHNRLELTVKQLSQRSTLTREVFEEIEKYKEYQRRKQNSTINKILLQVQKLIAELEFDEALIELRKVIAVDSSNTVALTLINKIEDMKKAAEQEKKDAKFKSIVMDVWREGVPSEYQGKVVQQVQEMLGITDERRAVLEHEVRNLLYKEALKSILLASGLEGFSPETIDSLRKKYSIDVKEYSALEAELLKEVRKNKVKGIVFILDSDEKFLQSLARQLRMKSYAVMSATSTYDAANTLMQVLPDIIISEVTFQGEPLGFDFYEFVRSNEKSRNIPFIFMSESFDRSAMLIGKRLGVDDFFSKPLDFEMLYATLDGKMLRKASVEKEFAAKKEMAPPLSSTLKEVIIQHT
jgi:CheY-like chemotaxis protein